MPSSLEVSEGRVLADEEGKVCEHVGLVPEEGGAPLAGVVEVEAEGEGGEGGQGVGLGGEPPGDVGDVEVRHGVDAHQGGESQQAHSHQHVFLRSFDNILEKPLVSCKCG